MTTKNHYRKVFKSDHLGVADLEDFMESGSSMVFTIKHVKQEIGVRVAGKKGDHNIAYFVENIKPLVLNAGNSAIVKSFAGGSPFVEDWQNIEVQFYIEHNVNFGRSVVSGVRIHHDQPKKITPQQIKQIDDLLASTGADKAKFLSFFKVGAIEQLPGASVQRAMSMLQSKVKK